PPRSAPLPPACLFHRLRETGLYGITAVVIRRRKAGIAAKPLFGVRRPDAALDGWRRPLQSGVQPPRSQAPRAPTQKATSPGNGDRALAREAVTQARAAHERAAVGFRPNFSRGTTYSDHEGMIQRTEGNVIKVNRNSLFVGGGPSMSFGLADVLFTPLVARQ